MTTTSKIDEQVRRAVMKVVLARGAPAAALAVPPGPNAASARASVGEPAGLW
jgi:hypothetical protein